MFELFYKPEEALVQCDELQKASWINVFQPKNQEKRWLIEDLEIKEDFITYSLDPSERPHFDQEDDQLFIVMPPF